MLTWPVRSIGRRLAFAYAASTLATISLLFLVGHELLETRLIYGLDLLNRSEFKEISEHLGSDYANLTPRAVDQRIRETTNDASVLFYINVQSVQTRRMFLSSNLNGVEIPDVPGLQVFNVRMKGLGELRVGEFLMPNFDVEIATPLAQVRAVMRGYIVVSLALIGILLLASIVIGLSLSRLILHPLRSIQETALRIGSDNLSERIPVADIQDELSNLARLLNQMFDRLETAFSQARRFAGEASHELKTSLSLIRLHTERLVVSGDLAPPQQEMVRDQLEDITRLSRVLDGLLFLSRAEANAVMIEARSHDVDKFIDAFDVDATALCEYRGCCFTCAREGGRIASFDDGLIRRVLLNLLSNALNASPSGGRITLRSVVSAGDWLVEVEDEGPGLLPSQQEKVFERFVRLSSSPLQDGGSGLGLPICRTILELHRGRIFLETRGDRRGLRAVFEIPQYRASPVYAEAF